MALRCSDSPGGATHFGSGWRANRTACSASERKPLVIDQRDAVRAGRRPPCGRTPARRRAASACPGGARAARRSRRRVANAAGPAPPGGASSASARARVRTRRAAERRRAASTATRTRTGAIVSRVGERHRGAGRAVRGGDARRRPRGRARGRRPSRDGAGSGGRAMTRRLEQPRVGVVHRPGAAERGEVGRPLRARRGCPSPRATAPSTSAPAATASSPPTSSIATWPSAVAAGRRRRGA